MVRKDEPYAGHVRDLADGRGADVVFNTVGDPYFQDAHASLAKGGRQILIDGVGKTTPSNILEFYRGRHTYVGTDTLAFSSIESGELLRGYGGWCADPVLGPSRTRTSCPLLERLFLVRRNNAVHR